MNSFERHYPLSLTFLFYWPRYSNRNWSSALNNMQKKLQIFHFCINETFLTSTFEKEYSRLKSNLAWSCSDNECHFNLVKPIFCSDYLQEREKRFISVGLSKVCPRYPCCPVRSSSTWNCSRWSQTRQYSLVQSWWGLQMYRLWIGFQY